MKGERLSLAFCSCLAKPYKHTCANRTHIPRPTHAPTNKLTHMQSTAHHAEVLKISCMFKGGFMLRLWGYCRTAWYASRCYAPHQGPPLASGRVRHAKEKSPLFTGSEDWAVSQNRPGGVTSPGPIKKGRVIDLSTAHSLNACLTHTSFTRTVHTHVIHPHSMYLGIMCCTHMCITDQNLHVYSI